MHSEWLFWLFVSEFPRVYVISASQTYMEGWIKILKYTIQKLKVGNDGNWIECKYEQRKAGHPTSASVSGTKQFGWLLFLCNLFVDAFIFLNDKFNCVFVIVATCTFCWIFIWSAMQTKKIVTDKWIHTSMYSTCYDLFHRYSRPECNSVDRHEYYLYALKRFTTNKIPIIVCVFLYVCTFMRGHNIGCDNRKCELFCECMCCLRVCMSLSLTHSVCMNVMQAASVMESEWWMINTIRWRISSR